MEREMVLNLRAHSPLALHRTRAGAQYVEALDYIPGSALRGALAEAYLAQHGLNAAFKDLFVSGQVHYGDLWPAIDGQRTLLLPATAWACKRHGLKHPSSLTDILLWTLSPRYLELSQRPCPDCKHNGKRDRIGGYITGIMDPRPVPYRSQLRVNIAIERSTGTAARSLLFSQKTLVGIQEEHKRNKLEKIEFQGKIRLREGFLQAALDKLLQVGIHLFLGSGRSRGLGEVEVLGWEGAVLSEPQLEERWQDLNGMIQRLGSNQNERFFSLTLLSHLVLRDRLLRPVLREIDAQHFGLPVQVVCKAKFIHVVTVPGWNAALGLPKPDTVALARGSALLFRCEATQEQAVLERMAQLEAEGVGERRDEGFGQVLACYPFHYGRLEVEK